MKTQTKKFLEKAKELFETLTAEGKTDLFERLRYLAKAANEVSPATGEQMDNALSAGVAYANTVKNPRHGFSIVRDGAGNRAVKFSEERSDGAILTYWLSEGARKVSSDDHARYGKRNLEDAEIWSTATFKYMVDVHLKEAIRGLSEEEGKLQTSDKALKLAFSLVTRGVRTGEANAKVSLSKSRSSSGDQISGVFVDHNPKELDHDDNGYSCVFFVSEK